MGLWRRRLGAALIVASVGLFMRGEQACAQTDATARIDEALQNITSLVRAARVGYATVWDGNKYAQCRRLTDRTMSCEAAGTTMQPSLRSVLTGERLNRLTAMGWVLDPSFGNYVRTFNADVSTAQMAGTILRTLIEAYDVRSAELEIQTAWVVDLPCPPRNGPLQNLAGMVNDAPSMRAMSVRTCSYVATADTGEKVSSAGELVATYGATVSAEFQRLRINAARRVYVIFQAGIGYVQCMPETPGLTIYCEAQSAESWPALAAVLTPERVARLQQTGYAEPGRAPNYSKSYPLDKYNDAALASELLTLLYDVYGYAGATKLKIVTD